MKITKVETFVLSNPLEKPFFFSQRIVDERRICIVKITTDTGLHGWGEGYGPADVVQTGIRVLSPLVLDKNPLDLEKLWFDMYRETLDFSRKGVMTAAISAIDIALWDIRGKALNLPVSTLLGGQFRSRVVPYATGMYFSETDQLSAELADEATGYVEEGFKAIKMKVGLSIEADVNNVKSVREAIGDSINLMVDANHAYSLREAAKLARLIEPFGIAWFEEPISPEFYQQYRKLRDKTSIPVAGGECEYLRYGFHQLLRNDCLDILQLDLCAAGGLTEGKRISALAGTYGVEIIPHTWGTGIAFHAAMNFIANLEPVPGRLFPPDFYIEYDRTSSGLREELTSPGISMHEGYIEVPQGPGLGIEVNEEALVSFTIEKSLVENN